MLILRLATETTMLAILQGGCPGTGGDCVPAWAVSVTTALGCKPFCPNGRYQAHLPFHCVQASPTLARQCTGNVANCVLLRLAFRARFCADLINDLQPAKR